MEPDRTREQDASDPRANPPGGPPLSAGSQEARDPQTGPSRLGQLARQSPELALLVARNPSTTAGMLRRFARSEDPGLLAAVCQHPSAPRRVVHGLAERFPEAFLEGPWGRDFLAYPALRPPRANHLRARLTWAGAPPVWFERASLHGIPSVRAAALLAPSLAEPLLERLASDPCPQVRAALARRSGPPSPRELALVADESPAVRAALASRAGLPDAVMIALARDDHEKVRAAAARQPAMPAGELVALARDPSWHVLWALVENPNAPTAALEQLAAALPEPHFFAWSVIHHPRANEVVSASLFAHPDAAYRQGLVLAARVMSLATWKHLCADPSPEVRHSLAFRGDVPDEVFPLFAADVSALVRSGIARNKGLPAALLERLARDPDPFTRSCAAENPSANDALHEMLAKDPERCVRRAVAGRTRSAAVLTALGQDPEAEVRISVFYNRATPPELQDLLSRDSAIRYYRDMY